MSGIVLHVRQGFEDDAGRELDHFLSLAGIHAQSIESKTDTALVVATMSPDDVSKARQTIQYNNLIFARQLMWLADTVTLPHEGDRVAPIAEFIQDTLLRAAGVNAFSGFFFETPDTDTSKELTGFCKSLSRPLENVLNKMKLLPKGKGAANLPRIHLIMTSNKTVMVAFADVINSNSWPMGIPRLRFPANAPSRSTLKLEEAFHVFLGPERMKTELKSGMTSVDLGACPGGWTYQLVKHGMFVTAVDNGSIDSKLMSSGLVTHLREDAFTYRPYDMVDWMVCDVVEQPAKIADLMTNWLVKGYCRNTIFNLKLPMKKRFEEVDQCLTELKARCRSAGKPVEVKAKQLYHDRKEITVFVRRIDS